MKGVDPLSTTINPFADTERGRAATEDNIFAQPTSKYNPGGSAEMSEEKTTDYLRQTVMGIRRLNNEEKVKIQQGEDVDVLHSDPKAKENTERWKEMGFIVDEDGYVLVANRGTATSTGFTAEDMKKMDGNYVVHTHTPDGKNRLKDRPDVGAFRSNGGTFSWTDIKSWRYDDEIKTKGETVIAPEGNYEVRFNKESDIKGFQEQMWNERDITVMLMDVQRRKVVKEYEDGRIKTISEARRESNNRQLDTFHMAIERAAIAHNIDYKFTPDPDAINGHRNDLTATKYMQDKYSNVKERYEKFDLKPNGKYVSSDGTEHVMLATDDGFKVLYTPSTGEMIRGKDAAERVSSGELKRSGTVSMDTMISMLTGE